MAVVVWFGKQFPKKNKTFFFCFYLVLCDCRGGAWRVLPVITEDFNKSIHY